MSDKDLFSYIKIEKWEFASENDKINFDIITEKLKKHGVYITLKKDSLFVNVYNDDLTRNAGRRQRSVFKENADELEWGHKAFSYADIMEMQKTMSPDEIATKLNMSTRTYYRRVKKMKEFLSTPGNEKRTNRSF